MIQLHTVASDAKCPMCGATVKWYCNGSDNGSLGFAECQDGKMVSRRLPGVGESCDWRGARVIRWDHIVWVDETDERWRA